jgi:hypothetical protein
MEISFPAREDFGESHGLMFVLYCIVYFQAHTVEDSALCCDPRKRRWGCFDHLTIGIESQAPDEMIYTLRKSLEFLKSFHKV